MPMNVATVSEAFQRLLTMLEPRESELALLRSHKTTIEQALAGAFTHFHSVEPFGSHKKGTAIARHSDVDYLARLGIRDILRGDQEVRSTTTLERVRAAIEARCPHTSPPWIDSAAVVIPFTGGAVDVVPGVWRGTVSESDGYPMFQIPDGQGGWINSSPQRYAKFIKEADQRSGFKLSRVMQILKHWKHSWAQKLPFLGFHVELLLATEGICVGPKSYQYCLYEAFELIARRNGAALNDPLRISGRIPLAYTPPQINKVVQAARAAAERAVHALAAENLHNTDEAIRRWRGVFNNSFPG